MAGLIDFDMLLAANSESQNFTFGYLKDDSVLLTQKIFLAVSAVYVPLITLSNSLVVFGMILYPGFYNSNNILLLSLSVADLLMGIYCLPLYMLSYIDSTKAMLFSKQSTCLIFLTSPVLTAGASLLSLLFITLDRYLAIMWPMKYRQFITVERTMKGTIIMWVLIIALTLVPFFGWHNYNYDIRNVYLRCYFYQTLPKYYVLMIVLAGGAPVLFVCTILYSQILVVVWSQVKAFEKQGIGKNDEQSIKLRNRIKTVKMTSMLMLMFIIMWLPFIVISPVTYFNVSKRDVEIIRCVSLILSFGNSLLNAPIYAIFREDYREVYRIMLVTCPWRWRATLREMYREKHGMGFFRNPDEKTTFAQSSFARDSITEQNFDAAARYASNVETGSSHSSASHSNVDPVRRLTVETAKRSKEESKKDSASERSQSVVSGAVSRASEAIVRA
ncbi:adenosine receptor A3-like [Physella acuta]|uniref:adenosine receptor A3-like n=1 Tax=Physella acuta TaxID=109671 RepID=UPI0027DD8EA7|nr:adenosine receptor A3-like [Physella acuta]